MFRISKRLDYGLQLMVALARENEGRLLATATLSERLNIPLPFLHQIGHVLMQAGLIKALPGPKGGLRLSRSADSITVLNVVQAIEGNVELNPNPMNVVNRPGQVSGDYITPIWEDLQAKILNYLSGINLEQLLEVDSIQVKVLPISEDIGLNSD